MNTPDLSLKPPSVTCRYSDYQELLERIALAHGRVETVLVKPKEHGYKLIVFWPPAEQTELFAGNSLS